MRRVVVTGMGLLTSIVNDKSSTWNNLINLLMIQNLNISKNDVANACKISEVTISKCFKKLYDYRSHILPDNIIF